MILMKKRTSNFDGVLSGLRYLDSITGGFKRGQFVTVTGNVASGKTTLLHTIMKNIPTDYKVCFMSDRDSYQNRMAAIHEKFRSRGHRLVGLSHGGVDLRQSWSKYDVVIIEEPRLSRTCLEEAEIVCNLVKMYNCLLIVESVEDPPTSPEDLVEIYMESSNPYNRRHAINFKKNDIFFKNVCDVDLVYEENLPFFVDVS